MTIRSSVSTSYPDSRSATRSEALLDDPVSQSVLVVEDDAMSAAALRIILTRRGYDVSVVSSVADATKQLENEPGTIILDLMLPDGDGMLILERLREMNSPAKVVVTTSVSDPDRLLAARHLRPQAILQKPINLAELFRVLDG